MKPERINIGDVFNTNEGGRVIVICDQKQQELKIKHLDDHGHVATVQAGNLRRGTVKNPYLPSVCGIGYLGVGDHKTFINGKQSSVLNMWRNMLRRCYAGDKKWSAYSDVTVCKEWHNFQSFASWFYDQPRKECIKYEIDKDLLNSGSKIYSPENCVLVPSAINMLLNDGGSSHKKSDLPVGVVKNGNKYIAQLSKGDHRWRAWGFATPDDAHMAYRHEKELYAKELASYYKGVITTEAYYALMSYRA